MKEKKNVTIWVDKGYTERVMKEMEIARITMEGVLKEWLKLDIGEAVDMHDLMNRPVRCYNRAIDKLVPDSVQSGRFSQKREAYLQTLDLPDPSEYYKAAEAALKVNYCSVPDLFDIDGQTVKLNEPVAEVYYSMADVIVSEPYQIARAAKLKEWIDLTNSLNVELCHPLFDSASLWSNKFFQGICTFENTDARGHNGRLAFLPSFLREVMQ